MKTGLLRDLVGLYTRQDPACVKARAWRFEAAYAHATVDFLGTAIASVSIAAIFLAEVAARPLAAWVAVNVGLAAARLLGAILYWHVSKPVQARLGIVFSSSLVLSGFAWSLLFIVLAPPESLLLRSATLMWIAGTASWVVAAYAFIAEAAIGFLLLELVPIAIYLAVSHERAWELVALAIGAFLPAMVMIVLRNNALLLRGHVTRVEKEDLAAALGAEKRAVEELNRSLAADLERRRDTENALREAKTRAEELARELEKLSSLDGLTEIANRRRFDQTLEREWNRAARAGRPLALIMCDIDYFKEFNDRYGHQAGDACLRQLASMFESSLHRSGDLAARYGGEEFAILMPDTEGSNAIGMAEALRAHLEKIGMPHAASAAASVLTASFGVAATVPLPGASPAALVKAADEALYRAKALGRNCVVAAEGADANVAAREARHLH